MQSVGYIESAVGTHAAIGVVGGEDGRSEARIHAGFQRVTLQRVVAKQCIIDIVERLSFERAVPHTRLAAHNLKIKQTEV